MKILKEFVATCGLVGVQLVISSVASAQTGIVLAQYPDIAGLAASYNEDDGFRVVVVARQSGEIRELFYKTANGALSTNVGNSVVAQIPGVTNVATFYARDDNFRILLVATTDGKLHEVFYHPVNGRGESVVAQYPSISSLAGFYDPATGERVGIVRTGGSPNPLMELVYKPSGKYEKQLGTIASNVIAMCASYYSEVPGTNRRIVTVNSGGNYLDASISDQPYVNTNRATGGQDGVGGTTAIACGKSGFYLSDKLGFHGNGMVVSLPGIMKLAVDSFDSTHVIVATSDGRVLLFIKP